MQKMTQKTVAEKYNFISFNDILKNIRNNFLTELEVFGILDDIRFNGRLCKKILRHSVLEEILKSYVHVDLSKTNVIVLDMSRININSGELFDEKQFIEHVIMVIDISKRKIPILIKKYSGSMDFMDFLSTGEGEQYLLEISGDKERLRRSTCSFKDFKIFAKSNGLRYICNELVDNLEFKKLFIS